MRTHVSSKVIHSLQKWNWVAFAVHCVLLAFVIWWLFVKNDDKGIVDIYRPAVVSPDKDKMANQPLELQKTNTVQMKWFALGFTLVTVIAHFVYATNVFGGYKTSLELGRNMWRYLEYGLSATLMLIIVAMLSNAKTNNTLILLAVVSITMFMCGAAVEHAISIGMKIHYTQVMLMFGASIILFLGAWLVIGLSFFSTVSDSKNNSNDGSSPPKWLWAVFLTQLIMFSLFAVASIYYIKTKNFATTEKFYIGLSLAVKTTLTILLIYGINASQ